MVTAQAHGHAATDLEGLERGMFFIVGVPRSGTTLLQAMLTSHPRMAIPPETEFFMKHRPPAAASRGDEAAWTAYIDRWLASRGFTEQGLDAGAMRVRLRGLDAAQRTARGVFLELLAAHAERTGKPRIGEKSPHHCRHVEELATMFPHARFIHIHRDPRDVVASLLKVPWVKGSHLTLARGWARIMRDHSRLVRSMPADRYMTVRYETLVERPEDEAARLCVFLGEVMQPEMLAFHERRDRGFAERESSWKGGTLRPVSAASVGRFRNDLTPRQIAGVQRVVGGLLAEFGYRAEPVRSSLLWRLGDAGTVIGERLARVGRSIAKRTGGDAA